MKYYVLIWLCVLCVLIILWVWQFIFHYESLVSCNYLTDVTWKTWPAPDVRYYHPYNEILHFFTNKADIEEDFVDNQETSEYYWRRWISVTNKKGETRRYIIVGLKDQERYKKLAEELVELQKVVTQ